jgi:hypothetical protein
VCTDRWLLLGRRRAILQTTLRVMLPLQAEVEGAGSTDDNGSISCAISTKILRYLVSACTR